MKSISTVYISKRGYQPVCAGMEKDILEWKFQMKEPWHLKMFPVPYGGDFSEQWMWLCVYERGHSWEVL
jgi:hypothetical protein